MRLLTDHPQWYDAIFDREGPLFHRLAFIRGGLMKRAQLELFDRIGLATPPHGTVRALSAITAPDQRVVVYEDELEHRGRGKVLLPLQDALQSHPDHYATLFVPPDGRASIMRHVRFGRAGFWIEQIARGDDWRSNVEDEETFVSRSEHPSSPIARVLWAIDFVPSPSGLLALDFNTAPDLTTLGEARAVEASELLTELQQAPPQHLEQL